MAKTMWGLFLIVAFGSSQSSAPMNLSPDMHAWALSAIDNIYSDRYREAEEDARKIIKKYPSHPAGYFFMAAAIDSWMASHFSDKREDEFYRFCELAVEKGERLLEKEPENVLVQFFIGGAEGYKGTYEARYERWITAFRYGWKGVSQLMRLRDRKANLPDLDYGIGSYEYWRSALMKNLWWMPGVDDKRAPAIEKLKNVRNSGVYSRIAASATLIDIFINERQFTEAAAVADQQLRRYPGSRIFLFGKARAFFGAGKYEASEAAYREVLTRAEVMDPNEEHAVIAYCHFWIAKNFFSLRRYAECIAECDLMKNYQFDDDSKKMLEKYFVEVETVKKQAVIARKNTQQDKIAGK
jgi:tetratricopeptide (TPR) repeat protein